MLLHKGINTWTGDGDNIYLGATGNGFSDIVVGMAHCVEKGVYFSFLKHLGCLNRHNLPGFDVFQANSK